MHEEVVVNSHTMKNDELQDAGEGMDHFGESMYISTNDYKEVIPPDFTLVLTQLIAVFSLTINLPREPKKIEVTVKPDFQPNYCIILTKCRFRRKNKFTI